MITKRQNVQANVKLTVSKNGEVIDVIEAKNRVVDAGTYFIASAFGTGAATPMSHMAVGTGITASAPGDVALETELTRVALDSTTVLLNVVTYVATFPPGIGTGAITEAGLFNAGIGGTMLARVVFGVKTKDVDDEFLFKWNITVSDDNVGA